MFAISLQNPIDEAIVQGVLEVLVLCVVVKVFIESRVIDSVYVDVLMSLREGFSKEGVMSLSISSVGGVKVFQLVTRFGNGQSLLDPVNGGVCDMEPGKSKDDILLSALHDIEEMFLSNPFNVHIESVSVVDCTSFVCSLVNIANCDGGSEFFGEKAVFPDKLPVNA